MQKRNFMNRKLIIVITENEDKQIKTKIKNTDFTNIEIIGILENTKKLVFENFDKINKDLKEK